MLWFWFIFYDYLKDKKVQPVKLFSKIIEGVALRKVVQVYVFQLFIFSTVFEITWGITLLSLQIDTHFVFPKPLSLCISVKNNTLRLVGENYKRKSSI